MNGITKKFSLAKFMAHSQLISTENVRILLSHYNVTSSCYYSLRIVNQKSDIDFVEKLYESIKLCCI